MFWRKKEAEKNVEGPVEETEKQKMKRRSTPRNLSDRITGIPWDYMREKHGLTGEQLMYLRQATWDGVVDGKPVTVVRIFDPEIATKKGVNVESYHDLDNRPELILYEGYYYTERVRAADSRIEKKNEWVRG